MLNIKPIFFILPRVFCSCSHFNLNMGAGRRDLGTLHPEPTLTVNLHASSGSTRMGSGFLFPGLGGRKEGAETTLNGLRNPVPGWLAGSTEVLGCRDTELPGEAVASRAGATRMAGWRACFARRPGGLRAREG